MRASEEDQIAAAASAFAGRRLELVVRDAARAAPAVRAEEERPTPARARTGAGERAVRAGAAAGRAPGAAGGGARLVAAAPPASTESFCSLILIILPQP